MNDKKKITNLGKELLEEMAGNKKPQNNLSVLTFYCEEHEHYLEGNIETVPAGSEHILLKTVPTKNPTTLLFELMDLYGSALEDSVHDVYATLNGKVQPLIKTPVDKLPNIKLIETKTLENGTIQKWFEWEYYLDEKVNTFSFSIVSNIIKALASKEWLLYLNADERLSMQKEEIESLKTLDKNVAGVKCSVHSMYFPNEDKPEDNQDGYNSSVRILRLIRNISKLHFDYRVHEQISPSILKNKYDTALSNILIKHVGYTDIGERSYKQFRNIQGMAKDIAFGTHKNSAGYIYNPYLYNRLLGSLKILEGEGHIKDGSNN